MCLMMPEPNVPSCLHFAQVQTLCVRDKHTQLLPSRSKEPPPCLHVSLPSSMQCLQSINAASSAMLTRNFTGQDIQVLLQQGKKSTAALCIVVVIRTLLRPCSILGGV